jgi:hypothetical protein
MHNNQNFTLSKDIYKSSLLAQAKILGLSVDFSNAKILDIQALSAHILQKTKIQSTQLVRELSMYKLEV